MLSSTKDIEFHSYVKMLEDYTVSHINHSITYDTSLNYKDIQMHGDIKMKLE